jgi:hypothetical protein
MQQVIFSILTNKKTRNSRVVKVALDKEFTAGIPWFDKSIAELPVAKTHTAS